MKDYNNIDPKKELIVNPETNTEEQAVAETKPKMKQILSAPPAKVKVGLTKRLSNVMFGRDGAKKIGDYVRNDIVIPAVKDILYNGFTSALSMSLFGNTDRGGYRGNSGSKATRPSDYGSYYPKTNYRSPSSVPTAQQPVTRNSRSYYHVEDYIIENRSDASEILRALIDSADRYNNVSVADYYEALRVETEFTDHNYGWTIDTIIKATVIPVRGGFAIRFPPLEVLD